MAKIIMKKYIKKIELEKKLTLDEISRFSNLVGDKHKLHRDIKYSKKKKFKNIICQGLFIASLCSSFVKKIFNNKAIIIKQNFNYRYPIYVNEKFRISAKSNNYDYRFNLYKINFKITYKKKIKCDGEIVVKLI